MNKLIAVLLLSTIGFSQNCENSILDEVLINDNINQYFQMALSLNIDNLAFLNNCDDTITYTIFAPGNNVPTASITPLLGAEGELMDYILYYITLDTGELFDVNVLCANIIDSEEAGMCTPYFFNMMDGNTTTFYMEMDPNIVDFPIQSVNINNTNISIESLDNPICACNGEIIIIDDLIWAPGINIEEYDQSVLIYPNPAKNVLNVSKIVELGVLEIIDMNGKVLLCEEIDNNAQIDISNYKKGIYLISFKSDHQRFREIISIN